MSDNISYSLSSLDFGSYIREIKEWFVPGILSEHTLCRMREVLQSLPGQSTNAIGLEFNNNALEFDCDVSFSIDPFVDKNELSPWRIGGSEARLEKPGLIDNVDLVYDIVNKWEDSRTGLSEVMKELYIEIDLSASTQTSIPLNIFLTLVQNNEPRKSSEIIAAHLAHLFDEINPNRTVDCFNFIAGFPKHLFITHLGFMVGRPTRAIRVLIRCATADLNTTLQILGLAPDNYPFFNEFFTIVLSRCSYVTIAVNVFADGTGTDFGIECGLIQSTMPGANEWWNDFINEIGTLGDWSAQTTKMILVETFKKKRSTSFQYKNNTDHHVDWGMNHIKVSFSKAKPPTMKWYAGMYGVKVNRV